MKWTSEPPKEPGHYWVSLYSETKDEWSKSAIIKLGVKDLYVFEGDNSRLWAWSGPIPKPEE